MRLSVARGTRAETGQSQLSRARHSKLGGGLGDRCLADGECMINRL